MPKVDTDEEVEKIARELLEEAGSRIEEADDGHFRVRLQEPVALGKVSRRTVGVRPARVGDIRVMGGVDGAVDVLASRLVEPAGFYDELRCNADMLAVQIAVERQRGKFIAGGSDSPSRSPAD